MCRSMAARSDGCGFGVLRKPHCGTLCRNTISGDDTRGQENKASRSLPFPLCSGCLSKAPQREREDRRRKILALEDQACSLLAMGVGRTGPRSLRSRSKEQGQNLSSMTKEDGWQGVWLGAGLSWVPRCRAWVGRIAPEGKLRGEDSDPGLRSI